MFSAGRGLQGPAGRRQMRRSTVTLTPALPRRERELPHSEFGKNSLLNESGFGAMI